MSPACSLDPKIVALAQGVNGAGYPLAPPFRPGLNYPEFTGRIPLSGAPNHIYPLCRSLFIHLGLDVGRFSTSDWNPLQVLIKPGMKVLIKPNLVRHLHMKGGVYEAVVTHASVVRCVLDYVALALEGRGEIIVGDAPVQGADFNSILRRTGLQAVCDDVASIWGLEVKLVDFRLWAVELDVRHRTIGSKSLAGDLSGYSVVDLGQRSLLAPLSDQCERFRVTNYDCSEMSAHHNRNTNEYLIPRSVLEADVVINLPKLKTHRKVGLTAALKNLVGINGHKDWLPHHRKGAVSEGGDEYLKTSRIKRITSVLEETMGSHSKLMHRFSSLGVNMLKRISAIAGNDPYEEGNWYGNDTVWRMVLDLNRALLYADRDGRMRDTPQRDCLTIVDGIIAGEGEGPMEPDPVCCAMLVGGISSLAVDFALASIIGFDHEKIPLISNGFHISDWPLVDFSPRDISILKYMVKDDSEINPKQDISFRFAPPSGWKGHIEL